jgi:hypothetical protein
MSKYLYSNDNGENYQKEFINCKLWKTYIYYQQTTQVSCLYTMLLMI